MATIAKTRARQHVLHYVLSFCIARIYDAEEATKEYPRGRSATSGFVIESDETPAQIGDLILLSSAPMSKWTLSWFHQRREPSPGNWEYLLESIEDGDLCWWSNVSISFLHRRALAPSWRWNDRQWSFRDRWEHVCYREKEAYIVRPVEPVFGEGFEVTLGTRTSHGFDDITPKRWFHDWRKVTKAMMAQCYDDCVAEREEIRARRKAAEKANP